VDSHIGVQAKKDLCWIIIVGMKAKESSLSGESLGERNHPLTKAVED
jgi:hypothetical protein